VTDEARTDAHPAGSGQEPPSDGPPSIDRRRLLLGGGLGGALLLGGAALGRGTAAAGGYGGGDGGATGASDAGHGGDTYDASGGHVHGVGDAHDELERLGLVRGGYGHGPQPPRDLAPDLIDALTSPPAGDGAPPGVTRELTIPVTAGPWAVAEGASIAAWMYDGRVPGPVIRATEGDRLRITVDNRTERAHNLHLHGRHDPQMDGWEPIPPGEEVTYDLEAGPAGLHPYHCHLPPFAEHLRRGLYGTMIVDPPGGREPAIEVMMVLSGFDLDGDGRHEVYGFNGICGLYDRHPITVPVGELVRVYLVNHIEGEPVAGFHLHAQTFDVYRSGTGERPDEHTDQLTLGQADRAVLEFRLPTRGRYMFHPHQHHLVERGAMGWFTAV
jgi:nitrite reductase (NO-forming)